jgi:hypothetical protein
MFGRIVTTAAVFLLVAIGHAQNTFFKTYGGDRTDEGFDVEQTVDGGYVIAGMTRSYGPGYSAVYLIKTDASGDTIWTRTYGGTGSEGGYCVEQNNDNGFIIFGRTTSVKSGSRSIYMIKTDVDGDTLWTHIYGVGIGWSGQQTLDGGYVISGHNFQSGILIKTDANGDTLWTRTYNVYIIGCGYDVQQTVDGGYIMSGEMGGLAALVKTDPEGRIQWYRHFGAKKLDRGYSVRQTTDGGYIMTGIQYIPGPMESSSRIFMVKTDAAGDTLWTRKLGSKNSYGNSIQQIEDNGYIITGYDDSFISLYKTDKHGNLLWKKLFYYGWGQSVRQTNDGGYIITGVNYVNGKGGEVFLLKTDNNGNMTGINNQNGNRKELPKNFKLHQNTPNPFNQSTKIIYEVNGHMQDVKLVIYDITGKEVKQLVKQHKPIGKYQVTWDGKDKNEKEVSSGPYLYVFKSSHLTETKMMFLVK